MMNLWNAMIKGSGKLNGFHTSKKASGVGPLDFIGPFTIGELLVLIYISCIIKCKIVEAYKNAIFGR